VAWLGFGLEEVELWFREAGLLHYRCETRSPGTASPRDLPAAFIASARKRG
jgi:hypothetical protein